MYKEELLSLIEKYETDYLEEKEYINKIVDFINKNGAIFGKENKDGHITASAWVVNKDKSMVLMTHHRKLDKWLQLGGHTEENESVLEGGFREALEESGLKSIEFLSEEIFDVDVHCIPARKAEKEHFHYDIRFMFTADSDEKIQVSEESKDVKWIKLDEVKSYANSKSILRMLDKTKKHIKNM